MRAAAIMALACAMCAGAATAQIMPGQTLGMKDPNAPIDFSADHFIADANAKTGIYSGNVMIRQGEVRMRADFVRFHIVDNKPEKIYAQGHVVVDAPSGTATGDSAVYDVNPRLVTMNGHVVLVKDKDVMSGEALTVNLITGVAQFGGGAKPGGRIHGSFTSQPDAKQNH